MLIVARVRMNVVRRKRPRLSLRRTAASDDGRMASMSLGTRERIVFYTNPGRDSSNSLEHGRKVAQSAEPTIRCDLSRCTLLVLHHVLGMIDTVCK